MNKAKSVTGRKYFAESALLLATIIWGGTFVVIKNSLQDISPMFFIGIRFLTASLILLPFALTKIKKVEAKQIRIAVILGIILFTSFALQTTGLKYTTATKSGFITGALVLFTPIFQYLIEKRKPTLGNLTGSFLVVIGLVFLSSKDTSLSSFFYDLGSNFNFGDFLTLFCAITFALQIVYMDFASRRVDFLFLLFTQLSVTAVLGLIFASIFNFTGIENISFIFTDSLFFGIAYTAILATLITFGLQTRFQKEVSPTKAGIIFSFEPVFAAILAYFVLNERLSSFGVIGGILIFMGLFISDIIELIKKNKGNSLDYSENKVKV